MNNLVIKFSTPLKNALFTKLFKRNYSESVTFEKRKKKSHPYRQIHPWKSLTEFSQDLVYNTVYNQDGLVVLNKPYGVSTENFYLKPMGHSIANIKDYTLKDALPYIAEKLGYQQLIIVRKPEKYMTGVTLLAKNVKVQNDVETALRRGNNFTKTYWIITTKVPHELEGHKKLAMKLVSRRNFTHRQPVIVTSWYKNEVKKGKVKILNVDFKVLSNSTLNLCSLIQIRSSTVKWHALRLFATTHLYCPVLGDNICASRIKKIGNTYLLVDPFLDCTQSPVNIDKQILQLLNIKSNEQYIIPVHIHLRSIDLPSFLGKENLTIEAPLLPPFDWTCQQLEFKYYTQKK